MIKLLETLLKCAPHHEKVEFEQTNAEHFDRSLRFSALETSGGGITNSTRVARVGNFWAKSFGSSVNRNVLIFVSSRS